VVLAGGEGRRLGGADKAELLFRGKRLLDRVVVAVADADRLIAVGPARTACRPLMWTREDPVGGGPVAAVAAALTLVDSPLTVIAAVDLPLLAGDLIGDLVEAATEDRAAVAVDRDGRLQPLLACYPTSALAAVLLDRDPSGMSMMELLEEIELTAVDDRGQSRDCDTALDLEDMRIGVNGGGDDR
jgi:molybdopterin-guanine dinucleotide biosynthesis protein A